MSLPTSKIIKFNALLRELKMTERKADILSGYGVESTKELDETQLDEIIAGLEVEKSKRKADVPKHIRIKRHQILNLLVRVGIQNTGNQKAYWNSVNNYLENARIAGKRLYEMNESELDKCIKKLHAVAKEVERRIDEEKTWAINN